MILDAGILIGFDRGDDLAAKAVAALDRYGGSLRTSAPVVAQVWRAGRTQARLARLLQIVEVHPFVDGRRVGSMLAAAGTSDVVDAHLVLLAAQLGDAVLAGDPDDLQPLADTLGRAAPRVYAWP